MVDELCENPSHWRHTKTLSQWMDAQQIPGICGIDTRALTKIIRENGTTLGKIVNDERLCMFPLNPPLLDPNSRNLVAEVSCVSN